MKRKKRAKKSVKSLKERIEEHEIKLRGANRDGRIELVEYYEKELKVLKENLVGKKRIIGK